MTEKYIYADVEKPFHVWVREGQRWILREAGAHLQEHSSRGTVHAASSRPAGAQGSPAA